MSNSKVRKQLEKSAKAQAVIEDSMKKCKMLFTEDKFYNDLSKPMFEAGKVYELEGGDWIMRWMKRGGQIVDEGKIQAVVNKPDPLPPLEIKESVEPVAVDEEKTEDEDDFGVITSSRRK